MFARVVVSRVAVHVFHLHSEIGVILRDGPDVHDQQPGIEGADLASRNPRVDQVLFIDDAAVACGQYLCR